MAPFEYTPLDRQTRSIRLLRFEDETPPTPGLRMSCLMETFELARCPPFVALSYTWGHPDLCREISINDQTLCVRENLYLAMSVLQKLPATQVSHDPLREHELHHRHFWVDAICINQEDIFERGHQVNLMEAIFTGATCVIAWLGIEADESKVAISTIRSQFRSYAGGRETHPDDWLLRWAFRCLSCRSYWSRMWIVQEFILPKNLLLLCGEDGAWWEDLVASKPAIVEMMLPPSGWLKLWEARERWQHSSSHLGNVGDAVAQDRGGTLHQARASDTKSPLKGASSLDELLFAFNYGQCADPRDRIYALLSLVRHPGQHGPKSLPPDYTVSAEQLYYRVLSHLRYWPDLAQHESWSRFRAVLFRALELDSDEASLQLHDEVYKIAGSLSWQQMAASFASYEEFLYRYLLWWQGLKKYDPLNSDTPTSSYRKLMTLFNTFPRDLDTQAWRDFDTLAKTALGIPGLPLQEYLVSVPGLAPIIDRYSRARQAAYWDKGTWNAFAGSHKDRFHQASEAHESLSKLSVLKIERVLAIKGSELELIRVNSPTGEPFWSVRSVKENYRHTQDSQSLKQSQLSKSLR